MAEMDETVVHQPPDEKRLNPFAFPAETNVRFRLLVVGVIMLAANTSVVMLALLGGNSSPVIDISSLAGRPPVSQGEPTLLAEALAFGSAFVSSMGAILTFGLILGLVFGVASAINRGHPGRIRKARKLKPFPPDKDSKFSIEIAALASGAGITPPPEIEIGERNGPADGQVFGLAGRYVMRLGGGMPLLLRKAPAMFRATVLHELAHIANGDIGRTYFSQSLWVAVAVLMIIPIGLAFCGLYISRLGHDILAALSGQTVNLVELLTVATPVFLWSMVQLLGLGGLYATIRASLLRVREVYADWRATLWGGGEGLTAIFNQSGPEKRRWDWLRLWRLHPTPGERLRLLKNPRRLFRITNDLPLLVGALIGAAASGVLLLSTLVALGVSSAIIVFSALLGEAGGLFALLSFLLLLAVGVVMVLIVFGPQIGLAYLAAGSLGLQTQRDAVAALALKERRGLLSYFELLRPAALFAIGMEIGLLIAPAGFFTGVTDLFGFRGSPLIPLVVVPATSALWVAVLTFDVWLWLIWAYATARRLLGTQTGDKPPESRRRFLIGWQSLILWLILVPALLAQNTIWFEVTPSGRFIPPEAAPLLMLAGFLLAGGAGAVGWVIAEMRRGGAVTCPACKRKTKHRQAVGRACEHCGADLAPWIIAQPHTS